MGSRVRFDGVPPRWLQISRKAVENDGNPEFHRFLQIASGSASELEYHFLLARDLEYLRPDVYESLDDKVKELRRMLASLIRKVAAKRSQSPG